MARSQEWATRIVHEASLHEDNSFITLTYSDENLPADGGVSVREVQLFIKRLRIKLYRSCGHLIRYFACGEYGGKTDRPHYHAIIFGHAFPDRKPWRQSASGHLLYRSQVLEQVWGRGHCEIGDVTSQSAGYVSRYILKKVTGNAANEHYQRLNPHTGEIFKVSPEFICMSSNPGIGSGWYDKYKRDAFPSDFVTIDGQKRPVPRYYTKKLADLDSKTREELLSFLEETKLEIEKIRRKRKERAWKNADNHSVARLAVREEVLEHRLKNLKRQLENDQ